MPESAMAVTSSAPDRLAPVEPERGFTPPLERLPVLLQRADAAAAGDARRAATAELNAVLGQMARYPSRPAADLLLRWLDQGALKDLQDAEGLTARAAAAAAVLSMGYPYALEISPDDLDHLRARSAAVRGPGGAVGALMMMVVTSLIAVVQLATEPGVQGVGNAVGLLVAMMASVVVMLSSGRRRRWAAIALLVSGLVAMSLALGGTTALLAPALGAMAAFAMGWPRPKG
ncbi:MAG TPA: hypothetical protein VFA20_25625 [Myxococcaceae bacterium]|nr:hypothetical protein [Myxococcaceae bacterium]